MNLLEFTSGLALRHLGNARVEALRDRYLTWRGRMAPALRLMHGTFDASALARHLDERVGHDFEILMVHSSVNQMLPMYTGTPLDLVRMLVDWCGPQRTLVMPAFWFGDGGRGAFDALRREPRFDLRRMPSQMGLATELFRRLPGVVQSRHPVYRVSALGPLSGALVAGHEHAEHPAGLGTPFEFMARHETAIVGIGKPMQVLTQAHHVEGLMGDAFPVPCEVGASVTVSMVDGAETIACRVTERRYAGRFDIWRLRALMDHDSLREWRFHHVPMFATHAAAVTERLVAAARRGSTLYRGV